MRKGVETGGGGAEEELEELVLVGLWEKPVGDTNGGWLLGGVDEMGDDGSVPVYEIIPAPLLELEETSIGDTDCPSPVVLGRFDTGVDVLGLVILPNTTLDVK